MAPLRFASFRVCTWVFLLAIAGGGVASYWVPIQTILAPTSETRVHFAMTQGFLRVVCMQAEYAASYVDRSPLDEYAPLWDRVPLRWFVIDKKTRYLADSATVAEWLVSCNVWFLVAALLAGRQFLIAIITRNGRARARHFVHELLFPSYDRATPMWRVWLCRTGGSVWTLVALLVGSMWIIAGGKILEQDWHSWVLDRMHLFALADQPRVAIHWQRYITDPCLALEIKGNDFFARYSTSVPRELQTRSWSFHLAGMHFDHSGEVYPTCGNSTPGERALTRLLPNTHLQHFEIVSLGK